MILVWCFLALVYVAAIATFLLQGNDLQETVAKAAFLTAFLLAAYSLLCYTVAYYDGYKVSGQLRMWGTWRFGSLSPRGVRFRRHAVIAGALAIVLGLIMMQTGLNRLP